LYHDDLFTHSFRVDRRVNYYQNAIAYPKSRKNAIAESTVSQIVLTVGYSKLESVMSCMQTAKTLSRFDLVIYSCGEVDRELL